MQWKVTRLKHKEKRRMEIIEKRLGDIRNTGNGLTCVEVGADFLALIKISKV